MHTRLILQRAIDIHTGDRKVNLLVAAHGSFVEVGNAELPAFHVAETLVHIKQVAGK